jgi:hypothetical protein
MCREIAALRSILGWPCNSTRSQDATGVVLAVTDELIRVYRHQFCHLLLRQLKDDVVEDRQEGGIECGGRVCGHRTVVVACSVPSGGQPLRSPHPGWWHPAPPAALPAPASLLALAPGCGSHQRHGRSCGPRSPAVRQWCPSAPGCCVGSSQGHWSGAAVYRVPRGGHGAAPRSQGWVKSYYVNLPKVIINTIESLYLFLPPMRLQCSQLCLSE